MKQVFIDTNVILDFVLQREHGPEAKAVVAFQRIGDEPLRVLWYDTEQSDESTQ